MDALTSPFSDDLTAAVEAAYSNFGHIHVSAQLEVCHCPVCMTEETRASLIATPVRDWSVAMVQEYSNSAHGVPIDLDDLRAILPRYLDLMAADEEVDYNGVGTELLRFGDAVRGAKPFLSDVQMVIYADWARSIIQHFGWLEAKEAENITSPFHALDMLVTGGVPVEVVLVAMDTLFDQQETGPLALGQFCAAVSHQLIWRHPRVGVDFFGMGYARPEDRAAVAAWLGSDSMMRRLAEVADVEMSERSSLGVQTVFDLASQWDATCFPDHRTP